MSFTMDQAMDVIETHIDALGAFQGVSAKLEVTRVVNPFSWVATLHIGGVKGVVGMAPTASGAVKALALDLKR